MAYVPFIRTDEWQSSRGNAIRQLGVLHCSLHIGPHWVQSWKAKVLASFCMLTDVETMARVRAGWTGLGAGILGGSFSGIVLNSAEYIS